METTSGKLLPSRQNMFPMSAECFFIHHSQLHKALKTANNCSDQSRLSLRAEVGSRSERPGPPERTGRAPIGSTSDPTWVRHWAPSRSERERRPLSPRPPAISRVTLPRTWLMLQRKLTVVLAWFSRSAGSGRPRWNRPGSECCCPWTGPDYAPPAET